MKEEQERRLRELILGQRVCSLAALYRGRPVVGLTPFALMPDLSAVLVHVSRLSRHGEALSQAGAVAILIHEGVGGTGPFQVCRLSLQGTAERLDQAASEYGAARDIYLERFPESAMMFQLGDFELYKIHLEEGRFVSGFAGAVNVGPLTLARLAQPDPSGL